MNGGYIGTGSAIISGEFTSEERQLVGIETRLNEGLWEGGSVEGSTESIRSHYGATVTHNLLVGDHALDIRYHLDDGTTFIESIEVKVGTSESPPILNIREEPLDEEGSAIFVASHPEGIREIVGRWFIRGMPMEADTLPLTNINGTNEAMSRTVEARYFSEPPLGCPCAFVVEATSNNGHIVRFLSPHMTNQWSLIPRMSDSSVGWLEPREGAVIDSWQSVEPMLELVGWSFYVDHLNIRPTVLNRCDVVPENASTTKVSTIEALNAYADGPLLLRLTSSDNQTLWNECRIIFLDRNAPIGSITTENQTVQANRVGVMVNLTAQDAGYDLVQDGIITWTHSLLDGGESQSFETFDQGRSVRINTTVPGLHLVRVTVEDIAGHTLRIELTIEVLAIEPQTSLHINGKPHVDNTILPVESGTGLSLEFTHPVHMDSDYNVKWTFNGVVVATGLDVTAETTWFNHLSDTLVVEVEHPEGKMSLEFNITHVMEGKELMTKQSSDEPTTLIFGLQLFHIMALLSIIAGVLLTKWLIGYSYRVPSWGKEPPSGQ